MTQGGRMGGYGFYLLHGRPVFTWNLLAMAMVRWAGPDALLPGKHSLSFEFGYDGGGIGKGGQGVLTVDGKEVDRKRMEKTIPVILPWDEAFNVGVDTGTAVEVEDYQVPFRFTGKLRQKLTIDLKPPPLEQGAPGADAGATEEERRHALKCRRPCARTTASLQWQTSGWGLSANRPKSGAINVGAKSSEFPEQFGAGRGNRTPDLARMKRPL